MYRIFSSGPDLVVPIVVSLMSISDPQEPKLVVLSVERRKLVVDVKVVLIHGNNI